jgi:CRP-like cAMP-binding protein
MISPELIRRYDFFAGLSPEQMIVLSNLAEERVVEENYVFFHEGDEIHEFSLVVEGAVGITIQVPDKSVEHPISKQLTSDMETKDITVTTIGSGMIFGWSAIIPPHIANATPIALTKCHLITFDCKNLENLFEKDKDLAYKITLKAAQVIRERLRDMQIESLSTII